MKLGKKTIAAFGLALCMAAAMATPAFAASAADGEGAENPKGDGTLSKESTGEATINSTDGTNFYTKGDDDLLAEGTDTDGASIDVWAKVIDSSTKIYKVDIAWGAMKFEFNSGSGIWNTTTHTYDGGTGSASWTVNSYLDGANNKVTVTNHSNNAVDAGFSYAMETKAFNDAASDNAAVGNFFADNTKAQAAALVLTNTYTGGTVVDAAISDKLAGNKIALPTADAYNSTAGNDAATDATNNQTAGARSGNVFFAFSGTPDVGRGATLQNFTKVGVITVTVAPNSDIPLNRPVFTP